MIPTVRMAVWHAVYIMACRAATWTWGRFRAAEIAHYKRKFGDRYVP